MAARCDDLFGRPGRHDASAARAALGPEIDDPVGLGDDVEVVLDHHHAVPAVDQAGKIPAGLRLQVSASPFSHSGWRWVDVAKGAEAVAWNDARGMTLQILAELDEVLSGNRTLPG